MQGAKRYRFGVFEVDAGTGELRRQGIRVRLHSQPFQLLTMLLERPGEMLTREEISRELWPDGTFVDYEHGVNSAVNRLREALGDKAKTPRYVETLARRGYRFVAPVERIESAGDEPLQEPEVAGDVKSAGFMDGLLAAPGDLPQSSSAVVRGLFAGLQCMYLGFYVGALANLPEINDLISGLRFSTETFVVLLVTAAVLIPVRTFLLCAVLFRAPGFEARYRRLWWLLLPADLLWSLAPFLLLHHMSYGLALAALTLLVYAPFAQRSLVMMGAAEAERQG